MTTPTLQESEPVLLRNGSVYTPADPFASAMIVEGGRVAWVGSEQAADSLMDDRMAVVDLDGDLLTPAFVDSAVDLTVQREGSAQTDDGATALRGDVLGTVAARGVATVVDTGALVGPTTGGTGLEVYRWPTVDLAHPEELAAVAASSGPENPRLVGARAVVGDTDPGCLQNFLTACAEASVRPALRIEAAAAGAAIARAVDRRREQVGQRALNGAGLRLEFGADLGCDDVTNLLERLGGTAVTVCLDPLHTELASTYYRLGIPVTLVAGAAPWAGIRALMNLPSAQERISARAGFTAATRGAWRGLGTGSPLNGQLVPGAAATYTRWEVEALMVQGAVGTAASWSTDPRARTPLLPALEDEALPRCVATVLDGTALHTAEPAEWTTT